MPHSSSGYSHVSGVGHSGGGGINGADGGGASSSTSPAASRSTYHTPIHPKAPTANLVSCKVLVSLIGQISICAAFQLWAFWYTRAQPWYEVPVIDPDNLNVENPENSALFLVSSFQYIVGSLVYSTGYPYRKPVYTNIWLMTSVTVLLLFSLYALFVPSGIVFDTLGLVSFPRSFHWALFAAVVCNTVLCFAFESYLSKYVVRLVKGLQRMARSRGRKGARRRHAASSSKMYKVVERGMGLDGEA
ncbi:uncharacterized protein PFL1_05399 [Pseudozyma flocculosa PF-1]|uniref:Cation-transporting P-type ATPase C-terminal domain-containing protein n=2 Tax=Pseudozyma flocculosa TaxID=84751 RepID=A0A5C3FCD0_9BASI|nr:uncharacterized protein PFL1_05399 [Pseudozyma flocculosa PF-1]EPQ27117.1 hypothetical protein PFL1_05399 [Pseudozyma flocculosa PF-1]SPO41315.1 uncharacterized protein PSFLO_06797 [Pseudozyma flocculosa]